MALQPQNRLDCKFASAQNMRAQRTCARVNARARGESWAPHNRQPAAGAGYETMPSVARRRLIAEGGSSCRAAVGALKRQPWKMLPPRLRQARCRL